MSMEVPLKYLTTQEAAQYLRMRKEDFVGTVRAEKIRYVPTGKGKLFDTEDLDRWMERHKVVEQCVGSRAPFERGKNQKAAVEKQS